MLAKSERDNKLCYEFLTGYDKESSLSSSLGTGIYQTEEYLFGHDPHYPDIKWLAEFHPEFDYCEVIVRTRYGFSRALDEPDMDAELYDDFSRSNDIEWEWRKFSSMLGRFSEEKLGDDSLLCYYCEDRPELEKEEDETPREPAGWSLNCYEFWD